MKPHDHLSCNWTAYRRALLPSPERDALLHRVASQLPTDGCYAAATVATEVAGLHSLVQRALQAYARSSGVPKPTTVRLFVTLSDAASERTGGLCTPTLPPRLGSEGFIRGTMLISGPTHRIHWWQPHPAAAVAADATSAEHRTTLLEPGGLLLHHTSLRYRAEPAVAPQSAGASLWLRFLVWATLPEPGAPRPKGGPPTPRFRDALLVPFRSPAHVEPPPPPADARGAAFAGRGPAEAARRALWAQVWRAWRDARPPSAAPSPSRCLARSWSEVWPQARADATAAAATASDGAPSSWLPPAQMPPALLGAAHDALARLEAATGRRGRAVRPPRLLAVRAFVLSRGQRVGPQPPRHGAHGRVLYVLSDGRAKGGGSSEGGEGEEEGEEEALEEELELEEEGEQGEEEGEAAGGGRRRPPFELYLLDPRAPAMRLEGFGAGAAWPFLFGNRYARPDAAAGALVAVGAGRGYLAAMRAREQGGAASWSKRPPALH